MTVQELIEQLQKLPLQALLQEARVPVGSYGTTPVVEVKWQGNHTLLETR